MNHAEPESNLSFNKSFNWTVVITFLVVLTFCISDSFAQNERNIWYFGKYAGVDFSSGSPVAITNSKLTTDEGCATICDSTGKLLFYTDGVSVWNRIHMVMSNGSGLLGNSSSTQSAVVVRQPGSSKLYYVFTVDDIGGSDGLQYSIVDMSQVGGLGAVTSTKNVKITSPTSEKIGVVKHSNKKDFWIITHQYKNTKFSAFLLTSSGVSTTAVESTLGTSLSGTYGYTTGYLKPSPDGTRLACASYNNDYLLLADFDASTGKLSNAINLTTKGASSQNVYGVEFSSNSKVLYATQITGYNRIVQYDLTQTTQTAIQNSMVTIKQYGTNLGTLQMGPDGKIYITYENGKYLLAIQNPDSLGTKCNFKDSAVFLNGKLGMYGLPTFIGTITNSIRYDSFCPGEYTYFRTVSAVADSVYWNFNDPGSGKDSVSRNLNPTHLFSGAGAYFVQTIIYYGNESDTLVNKVFVPEFIPVNLGNDTTICNGDTVFLSALPNSGPYKWQDGAYTSGYNATKSGQYWVDVSKGECYNRDTINVTVINNAEINLGKDTMICFGDTLLLSAQPNPGPYKWQDGSNGSSFKVTDPGEYWVDASIGNCFYKDTIDVKVYTEPKVDLGADTLICSGDSVVLSALPTNGPYVWQDGSTNSSFIARDSGEYWVDASSGKCINKDTILISVYHEKQVNLGNDTLICNGDSLILNVGTNPGPYQWSSGSTGSTLIVTSEGEYWVDVSVGNCINRDTIEITIYDEPKVNLGNDTTICEGENLTINALPNQGPYTWNDGSTQSSLFVNAKGSYWVDVSVGNCANRDTIEVTIQQNPIVELGKDSTICDGDSVQFSALPNTGNFSWQDGSTSSDFVGKKSQNYWVIVQDGNCIGSDTVNLIVINQPNLSLGKDSTVCDADSFIVIPKGTFNNLVWNDGSSGSYFTVYSGSIENEVSAKASINKCFIEDTIQVIFRFSPDVSFGKDSAVICDDEELILDAFNANATYLWQDNSTANGLKVTKSGMYWVKVANVCGSASDSIGVLIKSCKCLIYIPNAFSPNGDGTNEGFGPFFYGCEFVSSEFKIYDMWGAKIFETNVQDQKWDGTYLNKLVKGGVYFYMFEGTSTRFERIHRSGTVTVLR
ncbi:MAG: T9SS type B sorting domain-containing protein [Bacteroidetes bacterium]|nr:T9SS type B sorting domain-containing protein [Bacteroidota bacterium]